MIRRLLLGLTLVAAPGAVVKGCARATVAKVATAATRASGRTLPRAAARWAAHSGGETALEAGLEALGERIAARRFDRAGGTACQHAGAVPRRSVIIH